MTEYKVSVWENVKHTVWIHAANEDDAYEKAMEKIAYDGEDTIYDREYTGIYDVEAVNE